MMTSVLFFAVVLLLWMSLKSEAGDVTAHISGPSVLATDGSSRSMNITCTATPDHPDYVYDFKFRPNDGPTCASRPSRGVCTFLPQVKNDGLQVFCDVTDNTDASIATSPRFNISLLYPPQDPPQIRAPSQPLKQNDVVTCNVSGGKPPVSEGSVVMYCIDPDLGDENDVSDGERSVLSSVRVDTSRATSRNMTCVCSARWGTEPGMADLYQERTTREFMLQYRAEVTNFTVNGSTELVVVESDDVTAVWTCQGAGRPSPVMRLYRAGNDTPVASQNHSMTMAPLHTVQGVKAEDMGRYTCVADNNFTRPNRASVRLIVNSAPRFAEDCNYTESPPALTFALVAHPAPTFTFTAVHTGNQSLPHSPTVDTEFTSACSRQADREHVLRCTLTPTSIPQHSTGMHSLTAHNDLGNLTCHFNVTHAVIPPATGKTLTAAAKAGIGLGIGLGLLVLVVLLLCCLLRRSKKTNMKCNENAHDNTSTNTVSTDVERLRTTSVKDPHHKHGATPTLTNGLKAPAICGLSTANPTQPPPAKAGSKRPDPAGEMVLTTTDRKDVVAPGKISTLQPQNGWPASPRSSIDEAGYAIVDDILNAGRTNTTDTNNSNGLPAKDAQGYACVNDKNGRDSSAVIASSGGKGKGAPGVEMAGTRLTKGDNVLSSPRKKGEEGGHFPSSVSGQPPLTPTHGPLIEEDFDVARRQRSVADTESTYSHLSAATQF